MESPDTKCSLNLKLIPESFVDGSLIQKCETDNIIPLDEFNDTIFRLCSVNNVKGYECVEKQFVLYFSRESQPSTLLKQLMTLFGNFIQSTFCRFYSKYWKLYFEYASKCGHFDFDIVKCTGLSIVGSSTLPIKLLSHIESLESPSNLKENCIIFAIAHCAVSTEGEHVWKVFFEYLSEHKPESWIKLLLSSLTTDNDENQQEKLFPESRYTVALLVGLHAASCTLPIARLSFLQIHFRTIEYSTLKSFNLHDMYQEVSEKLTAVSQDNLLFAESLESSKILLKKSKNLQSEQVHMERLSIANSVLERARNANTKATHVLALLDIEYVCSAYSMLLRFLIKNADDLLVDFACQYAIHLSKFQDREHVADLLVQLSNTATVLHYNMPSVCNLGALHAQIAQVSAPQILARCVDGLVSCIQTHYALGAYPPLALVKTSAYVLAARLPNYAEKMRFIYQSNIRMYREFVCASECSHVSGEVLDDWESLWQYYIEFEKNLVPQTAGGMTQADFGKVETLCVEFLGERHLEQRAKPWITMAGFHEWTGDRERAIAVLSEALGQIGSQDAVGELKVEMDKITRQSSDTDFSGEHESASKIAMQSNVKMSNSATTLRSRSTNRKQFDSAEGKKQKKYKKDISNPVVNVANLTTPVVENTRGKHVSDRHVDLQSISKFSKSDAKSHHHHQAVPYMNKSESKNVTNDEVGVSHESGDSEPPQINNNPTFSNNTFKTRTYQPSLPQHDKSFQVDANLVNALMPSKGGLLTLNEPQDDRPSSPTQTRSPSPPPYELVPNVACKTDLEDLELAQKQLLNQHKHNDMRDLDAKSLARTEMQRYHEALLNDFEKLYERLIHVHPQRIEQISEKKRNDLITLQNRIRNEQLEFESRFGLANYIHPGSGHNLHAYVNNDLHAYSNVGNDLHGYSGNLHDGYPKNAYDNMMYAQDGRLPADKPLVTLPRPGESVGGVLINPNQQHHLPMAAAYSDPSNTYRNFTPTSTLAPNQYPYRMNNSPTFSKGFSSNALPMPLDLPANTRPYQGTPQSLLQNSLAQLGPDVIAKLINNSNNGGNNYQLVNLLQNQLNRGEELQQQQQQFLPDDPRIPQFSNLEPHQYAHPNFLQHDRPLHYPAPPQNIGRDNNKPSKNFKNSNNNKRNSKNRAYSGSPKIPLLNNQHPKKPNNFQAPNYHTPHPHFDNNNNTQFHPPPTNPRFNFYQKNHSKNFREFPVPPNNQHAYIPYNNIPPAQVSHPKFSRPY